MLHPQEAKLVLGGAWTGKLIPTRTYIELMESQLTAAQREALNVQRDRQIHALITGEQS
jgi:hypothetical protein